MLELGQFAKGEGFGVAATGGGKSFGREVLCFMCRFVVVFWGGFYAVTYRDQLTPDT